MPSRLEQLESRLVPSANSIQVASYLGGNLTDRALDVVLDSAGNTYVAGTTTSSAFPFANVTRLGNGGAGDLFVAKLSPDGTLQYFTTLGGSGREGDDTSLAVDDAGQVYLLSLTESTDLLSAADADTLIGFQPSHAGGTRDAYLAKLSASGNRLLYLSCLGGSHDESVVGGVAVNEAGIAALTGGTQSLDFPLKNPVQGQLGGAGALDAFVTQVATTGAGASSLRFSTYFGGTYNDMGVGIGMDAAGYLLFGGSTISPDLQTRNAAQPTFASSSTLGLYDAFAAKFTYQEATSTFSLAYSTYLGGESNDPAQGFATDTDGNMYISGYTQSSQFQPAKNARAAFQRTLTGTADGYVVKVDPSRSGTDSLDYGSYLGGSGAGDSAIGIAVDGHGNVYVTGATATADFPQVDALQGFAGGQDAFVAKLDTALSGPSSLRWSSFLGGSGAGERGRGIALDSWGNVHLVGDTDSRDFTTRNPLQPSYGGGLADGFVVAIGMRPNETAGVTVGETNGSTVGTEGGPGDSFTLVLTSQPTAEVTISLRASNQLTVSPTTLRFDASNWNVPQVVTVLAVDDAVAEGLHTGVVHHELSSSDARYDGLAVRAIEVSLADNDTAGVRVIESDSSTVLTEGDGSDSYTMVLTSQPTGEVTLTLSANDQLTVRPTTLTFNAANWNLPQFVTVVAVDDDVPEGTHTGLIQHTAVSVDALYDNIAIASVAPSIRDNDPVSRFDIAFNFVGTLLTPSQRQIFTQAAERWSSIILGDLPDVFLPEIGLVDDVYITASAVVLDGPVGTLGQAGPRDVRLPSFLPITGIMQLDAADLNLLEAAGQLDEVILHEIGHVLGFGTIWDLQGLLVGAGTSDPRFVGRQAVREYQDIFHSTENSVPVENTGGPGTRDGHWRESIFRNELMTGFLNRDVANPLSRVTVGAFADMGYEVDFNAADAYQPSSLTSVVTLYSVQLLRPIVAVGDVPLIEPNTVTKLSVPTAAAVGEVVALTATVKRLPGARGKIEGIVTFRDGTTILGSVPVTEVKGIAKARLSTPTLEAGMHVIEAIYEGSGSLTYSHSAARSLQVVQPTATTVVSSAPTTVVGADVTFTATVTATGVAIPLGMVSFFDVFNGVKTLLGTVAVDPATAQATWSASGLRRGSHRILARYSPASGSNFASSNSAGIRQRIEPPTSVHFARLHQESLFALLKVREPFLPMTIED